MWLCWNVICTNSHSAKSWTERSESTQLRVPGCGCCKVNVCFTSVDRIYDGYRPQTSWRLSATGQAYRILLAGPSTIRRTIGECRRQTVHQHLQKPCSRPPQSSPNNVSGITTLWSLGLRQRKHYMQLPTRTGHLTDLITLSLGWSTKTCINYSIAFTCPLYPLRHSTNSNALYSIKTTHIYICTVLTSIMTFHSH